MTGKEEDKKEINEESSISNEEKVNSELNKTFTEIIIHSKYNKMFIT